MPGSKEKFHSINEPGTATVIRKGSKYGDEYAKGTEFAAKQYAMDKDNDPAIARRAAKRTGAAFAGIKAKTAAQLSKEGQKFKGGGYVKGKKK